MKNRNDNTSSQVIDTQAPFVISFTSLVIILVAFFVFLNAIATTSSKKTSDILGTLHRRFSPSVASDSIITRTTTTNSLAALKNRLFVLSHSRSLNILTFKPDAIFLKNTEEIKAQAVPTLKKVSSILRTNKNHIEITYTGELTDISADTWRLPTLRTSSLYRFFLDMGIPENHLIAHSALSAARTSQAKNSGDSSIRIIVK